MGDLGAALLGGLAVLLFYYGCYNAVYFYVFHEDPPKLEDVIEKCPFCGSRTIALDYHLSKRCPKKPKSMPIKARSFEKGERRW